MISVFESEKKPTSSTTCSDNDSCHSGDRLTLPLQSGPPRLQPLNHQPNSSPEHSSSQTSATSSFINLPKLSPSSSKAGLMNRQENRNGKTSPPLLPSLSSSPTNSTNRTNSPPSSDTTTVFSPSSVLGEIPPREFDLPLHIGYQQPMMMAVAQERPQSRKGGRSLGKIPQASLTPVSPVVAENGFNKKGLVGGGASSREWDRNSTN